VFSVLFLGETLERKTVVAVLLGIVGVVMLVIPVAKEDLNNHINVNARTTSWGVVLTRLSALIYGFYTVFVAWITRKFWNKLCYETDRSSSISKLIFNYCRLFRSTKQWPQA